MSQSRTKQSVLTKEQKQLVEENYHLVFSFLHKQCLPTTDDNVSLASIGLCKAASHYQPEKGSFSTIAYYAMRSEFSHYWTYIQKEHRKTEFLSEPVDFNSYKDSDITLHNFRAYDIINEMSETNTFESDLLFHLVYTDFKKTLPQNYLEILELFEQGYTPSEVSQKLECVPSNIAYYRSQIKQKYIEFTNPKEGQTSCLQLKKQVSP